MGYQGRRSCLLGNQPAESLTGLTGSTGSGLGGFNPVNPVKDSLSPLAAATPRYALCVLCALCGENGIRIWTSGCTERSFFAPVIQVTFEGAGFTTEDTQSTEGVIVKVGDDQRGWCATPRPKTQFSARGANASSGIAETWHRRIMLESHP